MITGVADRRAHNAHDIALSESGIVIFALSETKFTSSVTGLHGAEVSPASSFLIAVSLTHFFRVDQQAASGPRGHECVRQQVITSPH